MHRASWQTSSLQTSWDDACAAPMPLYFRVHPQFWHTKFVCILRGFLCCAWLVHPGFVYTELARHSVNPSFNFLMKPIGARERQCLMCDQCVNRCFLCH